MTEAGRVSRSTSGNRAVNSATARSSGVWAGSAGEGETSAAWAMSLASMRLSWNRASTSPMASWITKPGRNAVASHWWVMVPMAVSMYSVRHLTMKGMPEKANSRYSAASRAAVAAAIRRRRLKGERFSSFMNRASTRGMTVFDRYSIAKERRLCQGGAPLRSVGQVLYCIMSEYTKGHGDYCYKEI